MDKLELALEFKLFGYSQVLSPSQAALSNLTKQKCGALFVAVRNFGNHSNLGGGAYPGNYLKSSRAQRTELCSISPHAFSGMRADGELVSIVIES